MLHQENSLAYVANISYKWNFYRETLTSLRGADLWHKHKQEKYKTAADTAPKHV